jgi:hypothetical protein
MTHLLKRPADFADGHFLRPTFDASLNPATHPAPADARRPAVLSRPMPTFSRPSVVATMLAAFAPAASTAVALPVVVKTAAAIAAPAAASPLPVPVAESPELLALGAEVDAAIKAYRTAADRLAEARSTAASLWPAVPDELVVQGKAGYSRFRGCYVREVDAEGREVWPPTVIKNGERFGHFPRNVLRAEAIRDLLEDVQFQPDKGDLTNRLRLAEQREADSAHATEVSGVMEAKEAVEVAADALLYLAYDVRKHPPASLAGILIHARVLAAYSEAAVLAGNGVPEDDEHTKGSQAGMILGRGLADAVLRVSSQATEGLADA